MKWREWINLKCAGVALYIQLRKHSRREIPRTSLCSASSSQPEPFPAQPLIKPTPVFFSSSPQKEKKKITAKGRKFARLFGSALGVSGAGDTGASSHAGFSKLLILQGDLKLTSCQPSAFAPEAAVG